jgi:hypothetical protein
MPVSSSTSARIKPGPRFNLRGTSSRHIRSPPSNEPQLLFDLVVDRLFQGWPLFEALSFVDAKLERGDF